MLDFLSEMFNGFASFLLKVLPTSPFQQYIDKFSNIPYLEWLNWLIPVKNFVYIGTAWLGVIALFYVYSILMRWVKMIGD